MSRAALRSILLVCGAFALAGISLLVDAGLKSLAGDWRQQTELFTIGTSLTIVSVVSGILVFRRYRLLQFLLRHGLRVVGTAVGFEKKAHLPDTDRGKFDIETVWFVWVDWTDQTGQFRHERSDQLASDPRPDLGYQSPVIVLVDPRNPKRFWIDVLGQSKSIPQESLTRTAKPVIRR